MNEETKTYFEKAGAIIVHDNKGVTEVLLEYREREYLKDWSFPKGGMEKGETPEETTIREIREETGLEIEIIKILPTIYYHNDHDGDVRQYMFLAKPTTENLRAEFDHDKVEWVPLEQVSKRLSYQNLKDYLEKVQPKLETN
ncbi:MAG: NUDIX domain-containing protein [bacterium]|nr:NUDIX domain-containing protein [bacterium]